MILPFTCLITLKIALLYSFFDSFFSALIHKRDYTGEGLIPHRRRTVTARPVNYLMLERRLYALTTL